MAEKVVSPLPNSRLFSIPDASTGFWQIRADDSSHAFGTFNTPFGRYRFKNIPFGISLASDVFKKVMIGVLATLEGIEYITSDMRGENISQNVQRLIVVLDWC